MTAFRSRFWRLRWYWRTRGLGRAREWAEVPLDCLEAARFAEATAAYRMPAKAGERGRR